MASTPGFLPTALDHRGPLVFTHLGPQGGAGIRSIIGVDDRTQVADTRVTPWSMVCHLLIEGPFGSALGTGWLAGPRTVVTAGHCVFDKDVLGGMATRIHVSPGQNDDKLPFSTVVATRFDAAPGWIERSDLEFDMGVIHLDPVPGQPDLGQRVGWFAATAFGDDVLSGAMVNVSGYPVDKPRDGPAGSQQWHAQNRISRLTPRRTFYEVDTEPGQSGGPAFIIEPGGAPQVIGVHAYGTEGGGNANSATRITPDAIQLIQRWLDQS